MALERVDWDWSLPGDVGQYVASLLDALRNAYYNELLKMGTISKQKFGESANYFLSYLEKTSISYSHATKNIRLSKNLGFH